MATKTADKIDGTTILARLAEELTPLGYLSRFKGDLEIDYRFATGLRTPFVWIVRDSGTHMIRQGFDGLRMTQRWEGGGYVDCKIPEPGYVKCYTDIMEGRTFSQDPAVPFRAYLIDPARGAAQLLNGVNAVAKVLTEWGLK